MKVTHILVLIKDCRICISLIITWMVLGGWYVWVWTACLCCFILLVAQFLTFFICNILLRLVFTEALSLLQHWGACKSKQKWSSFLNIFGACWWTYGQDHLSILVSMSFHWTIVLTYLEYAHITTSFFFFKIKGRARLRCDLTSKPMLMFTVAIC
jgi:hypothetical protein